MGKSARPVSGSPAKKPEKQAKGSKASPASKSPHLKKNNKYSGDYLLAGAVVLFTFLLYLHSLKNGFVDWDDPDYLRDSLMVHQLDWGSLKTMFTSFYCGNYHPLTTLTWAIEYVVSGYNSPALYHFDNLCLHLVNILLVFWFIRLISRNRLIAAMVAFWFGIHPMHVESVAWISERKDVLYAAFFLAGLIAWCYYLLELNDSTGKVNRLPGKQRKFYFLSLLFFLLSLLSKSAAVVFPLVLLLIEFLLRRRFSTKQLAEKIPFFALALLFGILAILSQRSAINRGMDLELSAPDRFFAVNYAIVRYIAMLFYPAGLSAYHPYPLIVPGSRSAIIYLSLLLNLILAGIAVYSLKYSRKWVFGLLFFLVNIILVLQILPFGGAFIAERYTYISYIGLFYILACLLVGTAEKTGFSPQLRYILIAVFILFSGLFSITTYRRISVWKDSLSLFDDVVKKYPGNYMAYYLRGSALQAKDADGAISDYTRSIALNPRNPKSFNNRGNMFSASHKYKEAFADYNAALDLDPSLSEALNNRGAVKAILGDPQGAMEDINKALRIRPGYRDAYRNRGLVKLQMNDLSSAREDWKKAAGMGDEISVKLLERHTE